MLKCNNFVIVNEFTCEKYILEIPSLVSILCALSAQISKLDVYCVWTCRE